jgi:tetratricopeptide (TPR) repeat protein
MGDYDKAIADYDEAVQFDPTSAWAFQFRGNARKAKEDYVEAIADLDKSIRLDPSRSSAYADRGKVFVAKKDCDKAIADFDEAIRLNRLDHSSLCWRGLAWLDKKEHDKAIADYSAAIQMRPDDPFPYHARAWIWATCPEEKHRDGKRAVESATKACELTKWNQPKYLETLAAGYAEVADFESAVDWQTKANDRRHDGEAKTIGKSRLQLYQERKPYRDDNL